MVGQSVAPLNNSWCHPPPPRNGPNGIEPVKLRTAYLQLIKAKVVTRQAEGLTGMSLSTMHRATQSKAAGGTGDKHSSQAGTRQ